MAGATFTNTTWRRQGLIYYWQLRHDLFSDRFQRFVASLEQPAQRMTVGNLLGQEMSQGDPQK